MAGMGETKRERESKENEPGHRGGQGWGGVQGFVEETEFEN